MKTGEVTVNSEKTPTDEKEQVVQEKVAKIVSKNNRTPLSVRERSQIRIRALS